MTDLAKEMVDQAARAIFLWGRDDLPPLWNEIPEHVQEGCRTQAKYALIAGLEKALEHEDYTQLTCTHLIQVLKEDAQ